MLAQGPDPRLGSFHPGPVAALSFWTWTYLQGRGGRHELLEMNIYAQGNFSL